MRRLLLDTHVFLWWLSDDERLGPKCRAVLADTRNPVFVSAATAWEMSIKMALGKLTAPDDVDSVVEDEGFSKLPISLFHGQMAGRLPNWHRDPFDRMLIAQCQAEGLELVSADGQMARYGIRLLDPTL